MFRHPLAKLLLLGQLALMSWMAQAAAPVEVEDVMGRKVSLSLPASRIVLGFYPEDYLAVAGEGGADRLVGGPRRSGRRDLRPLGQPVLPRPRRYRNGSRQLRIGQRIEPRTIAVEDAGHRSFARRRRRTSVVRAEQQLPGAPQCRDQQRHARPAPALRHRRNDFADAGGRGTGSDHFLRRSAAGRTGSLPRKSAPTT